MSRATLALFRLNIVESFSYNILCIPFTLLIICIIIWAIYDFTKGIQNCYLFLKSKLPLKYNLLLAAIILIDWMVNIVRLKH